MIPGQVMKLGSGQHVRIKEVRIDAVELERITPEEYAKAKRLQQLNSKMPFYKPPKVEVR